MTVAIVNAGLGNVKSVKRMIDHIDGQALLVDDPANLSSASRIILPGVGAFDHGMTLLAQGGWVDALNEAALIRKVPVLGICLGMQLLCDGSAEGVLPGLGWIAGRAERLTPPPQSRYKVPHIGWSDIRVETPHPLFAQTDEEQRYYFVHSYGVHCANPAHRLATTDHGETVTAAIARDNLMGVQFHPEKSHRFGMDLFRAFLAI